MNFQKKLQKNPFACKHNIGPLRVLNPRWFILWYFEELDLLKDSKNVVLKVTFLCHFSGMLQVTIVYADSKLVPWGIKFPRDWSCHLGRFTRQRKAKERKMLIKFFPSNPLKKSYTNPYGMAAFISRQRPLMTKQKYFCVLVLFMVPTRVQNWSELSISVISPKSICVKCELCEWQFFLFLEILMKN